MARDTALIEAYEHSVVVLCRFIDHLFVGKGIYYVTVKSSLRQQIGIHSAHVLVARGKLKRFGRFALYRRRYRKCSVAAAEQIGNCFGVVFVIESSDEVNGIAALSVILMKP